MNWRGLLRKSNNAMEGSFVAVADRQDLGANSFGAKKPESVEKRRDWQMLEYCRTRGLTLIQRLRLFDDLCELVQSSHDTDVYFVGIGLNDVVVAESPGIRMVELGAQSKPGAGHRSSLRLPCISRESICRAVDVWHLGQILVQLTADFTPLQPLMCEIIDRATAIGLARFSDVGQLRAAIAGFAQGKRAAAMDEVWTDEVQLATRAFERGLTPLPV